MKILNLLLLLFLLAGGVSAQAISNTSKAPGVEVLEKDWRRQVRNPLLEEDPLRVNTEQMELERARQQNQRDNAIRSSMGLPPLPPPTRAPGAATPPTDRRITVRYIYRAKVSNTGSKAIRKLVWEYVFFDPNTQKEIGRRRYESKVNIRPGKSSSMVETSISPPTGTIDATQTGKELKSQYSEQVVIQRIEYADGTVWQRDAN
jgi:hypothetical protein